MMSENTNQPTIDPDITYLIMQVDDDGKQTFLCGIDWPLLWERLKCGERFDCAEVFKSWSPSPHAKSIETMGGEVAGAIHKLARGSRGRLFAVQKSTTFKVALSWHVTWKF